MTMKRFTPFVLVVLMVFLTACGGGGGDEEGTGIKGQIFLAQCQGPQIATDCFSQEPYQATLIIYNDAFEELDRVESDEEGFFSYSAEAGVYFIHPYSPGPYPIATDYQVVVVEGEWTEMTVIYDSGMR